MKKIDLSSLESIKSHCNITEGGCWNWKHGMRTSNNGKDARAYYQGVGYVYRASWSIANNTPVSKNMFAMHKCNNGACVNPDHIEIGTHAKNMSDAARDGLMNHKLTDEQVERILSTAGEMYLSTDKKPSMLSIARAIGDNGVTRHDVRSVLVFGYNVERVIANRSKKNVAQSMASV